MRRSKKHSDWWLYVCFGVSVCFYLYENVGGNVMLCENQTTHRSRQAKANTLAHKTGPVKCEKGKEHIEKSIISMHIS